MVRSSRFRPVVLFAIVVLLFTTAASPAIGASAKKSALGSADRTVLFASDGMRPGPDGEVRQGRRDADLQGADEGRRDRRQRDGPGLPAEHRRRLVHDGHRHLPVRARLDEQHLLPRRRHVLEPDVVLRPPGRLQADTIANAAERAGKKVAQIDWVGGAAAGIDGPDRRLHQLLLEPRRARRRRRPDRAGGLGVLRRHLPGRRRSCPAAGWSERPDRRSGGDAEGDDVDDPDSTFAAQNPNRTYNVYFYDSVTGGGVEVRPRHRQPGRQDGRGAVDRPRRSATSCRSS